MKGRRAWTLAVVLVIVLAGGAFVARDRDDKPRAAPALEVQGADEIAHVHGLGINPADGDLYAATHYGVYRVDVGTRTGRRVGDLQQDTMGFTVAGDDDFLASGHPDFRYYRRIKDRRPLLGLIQSHDGGRTWQELSLGGQADFHGLVISQGLVYGWSSTSGEFMVSNDKRTWERRSTVGLNSFVVDPRERDHIIASGEGGGMGSRDGGRSWQPMAGPANAFLAWGEGAEIWAARFEDGAVSRSPDGGATWQGVGSLPGRAEALLHHEGDLYAAVTDVGLLRSGDDGTTWATVYKSAH